ncbi:Aminoacylase-1 [Armadillidium nasatum]|uniref:Aminoacylase-1 n=1 Tax=Armadillidium nasatum TaxID=96803 RepID=A0A5N5SJG5_9CRUS|nr:Aminoacylase-1 [Armadillidium nasatum]
MENPSVTNFREYIQINTMQPKPDYASAVVWLKKQAEELSGEFNVTECVPGKPIVIITINGKNPQLPSILLNSHIDVVPVFPEHWKHDPFSAHKDEKGDIYGRGTQDMKCVAVQYIEALKEFKKEGIQFLRTFHLSFVPDEEIGGKDGMAKFLETKTFKNLNVGFGLDEELNVKCPGPPGHGSQFIENTAGQKIRKVINSFMSFRDSEEKRLKSDPNLDLGDVTTVNLTILGEFDKTIRDWCKEAGEDITIEPFQLDMIQDTTCVEDGKNAWWDAFRTACEKEKLKLTKKIFPAGTDSRYLRGKGIPALGFSPMNHTPILLHDHNEFLNEKIFLRGIQIYKTIISHIGNLP